MRKKIFGILLLFSLATVGFTGCKDKQKKENTTESSSSADEKKQTETSKEEEKSTSTAGEEASIEDGDKKSEENKAPAPAANAKKAKAVKKKGTAKAKKGKKAAKPAGKAAAPKYIKVPYDVKKAGGAANQPANAANAQKPGQPTAAEKNGTIIRVPQAVNGLFVR